MKKKLQVKRPFCKSKLTAHTHSSNAKNDRQRGSGGRGIRTLLEGIDLVQGISLGLLSLKSLLCLDLLSKLLQFPLCLGALTGLDRRILIQKTLADLGHMVISLDHLCKVVVRSLKDAAFLLYPVPSQYCGFQSLVIEGDLAVEIIVRVGNVDGLCRGDGLSLRPGDICWEGDLFTETLQSRLEECHQGRFRETK